VNDEMTRKIGKLLAQSEKAGTEAEAEVFLAKAQDAFDAMLEERGRNPRAFVMGLPLIQELARLVALDSVATNETQEVPL